MTNYILSLNVYVVSHLFFHKDHFILIECSKVSLWTHQLSISHRFPIWVFHSSFTIIWKQNSLIARMQLVWSVWSKYPPYETFSSVSTFVHVRPLYVKVIIMHVLFIIAYVDELWTTTRALIDYCFAWERINLNRK